MCNIFRSFFTLFFSLYELLYTQILLHPVNRIQVSYGDFQVDKKRHLGNDIVAIVFQDSNTPFCPTLMKTKVTHAYVVVQPMEIDGPTQYKVKFNPYS